MINYDLTKKFFKFSSIVSYEDAHSTANKSVKNNFVGLDENKKPIFSEKILPKEKYVKTVKTHGTNGSIVIDRLENVIYFQNRKNVINLIKDNFGFAHYMSSVQDIILSKINEYVKTDLRYTIIYGEWVGSNIQNCINLGVALLEQKHFIILDIVSTNDELKNSHWEDIDVIKNIKFDNINVHNIYEFEHEIIEIDFSKDYTKLFESMISNVEASCPVAKKLTDKDAVGEGFVFRRLDINTKSPLVSRFKIKGELHSIAIPEHLKIQKKEKYQFSDIKEKLANDLTPMWRLGQFFTEVFYDKEANTIVFDKSKIQIFIKAVFTDIVKEESGKMLEYGFTLKDISSYISKQIVNYYNDINKSVNKSN